MMSALVSVGRLAEVRFSQPFGGDDLLRALETIRAIVRDAASPLVFACDWRGMDTLTEAFIESAVRSMRNDNPKVAANGILLPERRPLLQAQVVALLRDARNPSRQVFTRRSELTSFLHPVLTPLERVRCEVFLDAAVLDPARTAKASRE